MPIEEKRTIFKCSICGKEYILRSDAIICEETCGCKHGDAEYEYDVSDKEKLCISMTCDFCDANQTRRFSLSNKKTLRRIFENY